MRQGVPATRIAHRSPGIWLGGDPRAPMRDPGAVEAPLALLNHVGTKTSKTEL